MRPTEQDSIDPSSHLGRKVGLTRGEISQTRVLPLRKAALNLVGIALLGLWAYWWIASYFQNRLSSGRSTWLDVLPFLAGDFRVHIDHTARLWAKGQDLYHQPCDWVCDLFPYPPMVPRLFTWVSLLNTSSAIAVWLIALTAILTTGAWFAWRTRQSLGLRMIPWPLALSWILFSTPVMSTLERGQCDGLVVGFLLLAVALIRYRSFAAQFAAGAILALAAWTKYYPGLTLLGLLTLRRWWSIAGFVLLSGAIAVYDAQDVRTSIANGQQVMASMMSDASGSVHHAQHAIPASWRPLWRRTRNLDFLAQLPPPLATAALLVPLLAWVSLRLAQCKRSDHLAYPYFLWLVSLGTFAMPYSNDYNLIFLPLGVLAVWDRRDPVPVHMAYGLLMLWWQPFWLPVRGDLLLVIKFAGLAALGASLVAKTTQLTPRQASDDRWATASGPHLKIQKSLTQSLPLGSTIAE